MAMTTTISGNVFGGQCGLRRRREGSCNAADAKEEEEEEEDETADAVFLRADERGVSSTGRLGTCDNSKPYACFSSMDDRPPFFVAPWEFSGTAREAAMQLSNVLRDMEYQVTISNVQQQSGAIYVSAEKPEAMGIQLLEFFFDNDDSDRLVQVRANSSGANKNRSSLAGSMLMLTAAFGAPAQKALEGVRVRMGWDEAIVLRNRKRVLGIIETPFDSYGPVPPFGESVDSIDPDDRLAGNENGLRAYERFKD